MISGGTYIISDGRGRKLFLRSLFERVDGSKLLFVCVRERERECREKRRRGGKEGERKR